MPVMPTRLDDSQVRQAIAGARGAGAARPAHPSPADWRDLWIYFLLLNRFNNPDKAPTAPWDRPFRSRQGGTFAGVTAQLDYLSDLGCGALWLSPVLKN